MKDFTYYQPVRVFLGEGMVEKELGAVLPLLGSRVMLTYGGQSAKRNGTLDEVLAIMTKSGISVVEFGGIMPNPTYKKVQEGAALAKAELVTGILALGGGSVVDASKIIALQAANEADVWTVELKEGKALPVPALPLGAIVTASGTGSEMNGGAVITNEDDCVKTGLFASAPIFAFLDYHFMESLPAGQVLSGAFDTLSHAMETYLGRSDEDNASDDISLGVMRNTVNNIRRIIKDIHDKEARANLMWDSAMAENGILKLGRMTDFEVHQIEHQLGAYTDCNHGQGLAVIQPVYMRHILKDAKSKLAAFARLVMGVVEADDEKAAAKGIGALEALILEMGLPTRLSELRVSSPVTDDVLHAVARTSNKLVNGPRTLDEAEIYEILKECL